jgi:DNA-binding transcriptional ArsR family regulator
VRARRDARAAPAIDGKSAAPADVAPVFAALGDRTRLRIVSRLCEGGPQSIMRLSKGARVSRQAITKHLRVLDAAGLARGSRAGRERVWELRTTQLSRVQRYLNEISLQWDVAIDRLKALVEHDP